MQMLQILLERPRQCIIHLTDLHLRRQTLTQQQTTESGGSGRVAMGFGVEYGSRLGEGFGFMVDNGPKSVEERSQRWRACARKPECSPR